MTLHPTNPTQPAAPGVAAPAAHGLPAANLLAHILDPGNLFAAWEKVRKNEGMAGADGQSIEHFEHNVFGRLLTLKHQVERHEYQPHPLLSLAIAKPDGSQRRLAIPTVRDRILQTAASRVLTPLLDRHMEDASYAYRAGRSVAMAVARVAHHRDQGYHWVVDADIQTFFDEIDHRLLLDKLRRSLTDPSPLPLIESWLAAIIQPADGQTPYFLTKGVPQGSPLSPLLSNLYLDDFDEALLEKDLRLVRFADDFLILCKDRAHAEEAMELTEDVVETLKLRLKPEKTRITHFEEGFSFLGVSFIRNLMRPLDPDAAPWVMPRPHPPRQPDPIPPRATPSETPPPLDRTPAPDPDEDEDTPDPPVSHLPAPETHQSTRGPLPGADDYPAPEDTDPVDALAEERLRLEENPGLDPALRSLVVVEQGLTLYKEGERLLVAQGRDPLASVPLGKLDQILIHGNQLISTALFRHAHQHGLSISFHEAHGRPIGRFDGRRNDNLELHRQQFARQNEADFQLMLARALVAGKIHNARLLLRRHNRRRQHPDIDAAEHAMRHLEERLAHAPGLENVRGLEGAAAREYFGALRTLLPEHWNFTGRRRSPPPDPLNVLLSYGYGVLHNTLNTLMEQRGLYPWLGSLHTSSNRHPALAADLMEEFRAPIVDAVALNALLHALKPADFLYNGDATLPCRLSDSARKRYVHWLQNKFRSGILHPRNGQKLDHHRLIQAQVHHYARVILGEDPVYHPCRLK